MDLPIDKTEFDYIVTALWKCRGSEDPCEKLYDKLRLLHESELLQRIRIRN